MTLCERLEFDPVEFPNLNDSNHRVTSDRSENYDCIAWAVGDTRNYFSGSDLVQIGGYYWPPNVPPSDTVDGWSRLFTDIHGYEPCDNGDVEPGFIKVAIYADAGAAVHAARQLEGGKWTSKLGSDYDIEHDTPGALEGNLYGNVDRFLRKREVARD